MFDFLNFERDNIKKTMEIGNYLLQSHLGEGASGSVFSAINRLTQENCCVKIIPKVEGKLSSKECFLHTECKVLQSINHPNIVKYVELIEDAKNYYLVEELCYGITLTKYMENGKILTDRAILIIMQQLLSAIQYIHYKGISHRDIKPDNIMITQDYQIKLIDFGLSTDDNTKMRETFCGSVAFSAPECITHTKYDARLSDIWSCGVICFFLATGNLPWRGNIVQVMRSITTNNFIIPTSISLPIRAIIQQCLQMDPLKRPSADKLLDTPFFKSSKVSRSPRLLKVQNSYGQMPIIKTPITNRTTVRKRTKILSV